MLRKLSIAAVIASVLIIPTSAFADPVHRDTHVKRHAHVDRSAHVNRNAHVNRSAQVNRRAHVNRHAQVTRTERSRQSARSGQPERSRQPARSGQPKRSRQPARTGQPKRSRQSARSGQPARSHQPERSHQSSGKRTLRCRQRIRWPLLVRPSPPPLEWPMVCIRRRPVLDRLWRPLVLGPRRLSNLRRRLAANAVPTDSF